MQAFIVGVLIKIWQNPQVRSWIDAKWDDLKASVQQWISDELKSWVPIFLKAIFTGIAQSAGQLVVNTEDRITDIIPGQIDDAVLDPMVHTALDKFTELTGIKLQ